MRITRFNKKIISLTILISIYIIFLVPTPLIPNVTRTQNAETTFQVSLCEQCHVYVIEKQFTYTHSPFILKQCDNCHVPDNSTKTGFCSISDLEQIGIEVCSKPECHPPQDLGISHPVGINAEGEETQIPNDLPTGDEEIILCITCHNPHGGDKEHLVRPTISKKLCAACHKESI